MNRVIVSTDCVCDLPKKLIDKYSIPVMYYYMQMENARFQDINEINSDSILEYIEKDKKMAASMNASAEEYKDFFLKQTEGGKRKLIHISLAKNTGGGFDAATQAAKDIDNVYVVDSGKLSGGMGLLVLVAADLARKGATAEIILQEIERVREKVDCTFTVKSTQCLAYNKRFNQKLSNLLDSLSIHPIITMKNSKMVLGGVCFGNMRQYVRGYIQKTLSKKESISDDVVIIITAGCPYEMQQMILEEAQKHIQWKHIFVESASATVSCNCGSGSFGLLFFRK